jgi:acetyl esterase/lipase
MRKVVVLAVLGGSCALMGSRYLSGRAAIAAVPAELRSPFMFFPFPSTARMLPLIRQVFRLSLPPGPGVTVTRHRVDGIPVQVTTPTVDGSGRPAVLWIHGGGTVIGSPQFESRTIGRMARELNAVVVSPDYRLAPEHPFPAPLDVCMATLSWMRDNAY